MLNKLDALSALFVEKDTDIVILSETWCNPNVKSPEISFQGYNLVGRRDRDDTTNGRGGGLLIYAKSGIPCLELNDNFGFQQVTGIRIGETDLFALYRSPNASTQMNEELNDFLDKRRNPTIIVGDLNYPSIDWTAGSSSHNDEQHFLDTMISNDITQLVQEPTHEQGNLLDVILTNCCNKVGDISYDSESRVSDHYILEFTMDVNTKPTQNTRFVPDMAKADLVGMSNELAGIDWHQELTGRTATESWVCFKQIFKSLEDKFIPTKRVNENSLPIWMNRNTLRLIRKKRKLWDFYKNSGALDDFLLHKEYVDKVKKEVKKAKTDFEKALLSKVNKKKFFSYMRSKTKSKDKITTLKNSDGDLVESDIDKCEILNQYFNSVFTKVAPDDNLKPDELVSPSLTSVFFHHSVVSEAVFKMKKNSAPGPDGQLPKIISMFSNQIGIPLSIIFNKSMESGDVPQDFKDSNIIPLFKKGKRTDPSNYRPISLTSVIGKLFERLIKNEIVPYLEDSNLLAQSQHGFRSNHSTVTNLIEYYTKVVDLLDMGESVDVIFFDLKKAFDKVSHPKLLQKLGKLGIGGNILQWISSWLSGRRQRVGIDGQYSKWMPVTSGVPQGSVLGPLLFLVFINDLPEGIKNAIGIFADDTKLMSASSNNEDVRVLQEDIDKLHAWSIKWQMEFSATKCSVIHMGRKNKHHSYSLGQTNLPSAVKEKDLGVLVDNELKFSDHCRVVVNKCNSIIGQVKRSFKNRERSLMMSIFNMYILPHLDYACQVWCPRLKTDSDMIESVQRRFTKLIFGLHELSYEERLLTLNIPTLEVRRKYLDVVSVYRIKNGIDTLDKNQFCLVRDFHAVSTRSSRKDNFVAPKTTSKLKENFFSIRAISNWNKLPIEVQTSASLNIFKKSKAKMFMFS